MAKFVELVDEYETVVSINPMAVKFYYQVKGFPGTRIKFIDGSDVTVKETPEDLSKLFQTEGDQ